MAGLDRAIQPGWQAMEEIIAGSEMNYCVAQMMRATQSMSFIS